MGVDLSGWVEHCDRALYDFIDEPAHWTAMFDISPFVWRQYGVFTYFFGEGSRSARPNGLPLAARRGLPTDASIVVRDALVSHWGATWITADEIAAGRDDDFIVQRRLWKTPPIDDQAAEGRTLFWNEPEPVVADDRLEYVTLGEAIQESGLETVFAIIALTAARFGGDNVRLVVGFH